MLKLLYIDVESYILRRDAESQQAIKAVLKKYDTNKSGKLEEDQIRKLLTDIDDDTPPGLLR